jgi:hypothetical protein
VLYRADGPAQARPARPGIAMQEDDLSGLLRLSAPGAGGPRSVAFALKRPGGAWRRVAVDDSAPYRAFLDPRGFRRGERVELVAIERTFDGTITVSRVLSATPRRR